MVKGIYLALPDVSKHVGVKKKIEAQIQVLKNMGISLEYIELNSDITYNSVIKKLIRRLPFFPTLPPLLNNIEIYKEIDVLYFRYYLGDYSLIKFLRILRTINPNIIIIFEFVDWPYVKYYFTVKDFLLLAKDLIVRNYFRHLIDRAVVFTNDKEVLGIKTLHAQNGILVCNERKKKIHMGDSVNIICVSTMRRYHGYDRLLKGLKDYYHNQGTRDIMLHFVGEGPELLAYQKLVAQMGLSDRTAFYGEKTGEDLDCIYDCADIACASLGLHRIGMPVGTSLKTAEYLAKGLPVIISGEDSILSSSNTKYCLQIPANDSPIDFFAVLEFFESIYCNTQQTKLEIIDDIRNWAHAHCDMSIGMENIIEYIVTQKKQQ